MDGWANEASKKFFGQVWDDLIGYFKIYDFLKLKTKVVSGKSQSIPSINSFWYSVLGDKFAEKERSTYFPLKDGDVIKLKNIFMTEWSPKIPGRIWTVEGRKNFHKGLSSKTTRVSFNSQVYSIFSPYEKQRIISSGFGSIRLRQRTSDKENYMYMALVDDSKWRCDYGIPLIVSESVYNEFLNYSQMGAPWLKGIEGVFRLNRDLPFYEMLPSAIGAKLSKKAEETLRYRPGLPKCFIQVTSPLSIKFTYNDSHPNVTAWTMFKTSLNREPYRFTYTTFNPKKENSIEKAIEFINWYVKNHQGKKIITDFDGMIPRLEALIPIKNNPIKDFKIEFKKLISDYDKWIRKIL